MNIDLQTAAAALRTTFALFLCLCLLRYLLLPLLVDDFRARVFDLRRELFLYMAAGRIEPNHPAYVCLRSTMNGLIRDAERVTVFRSIMHAVVCKDQTREYSARLDRLLESIDDPAVRRVLVDIRLGVNHAIAIRWLKISPLLWVLIPIFLAWSKIFPEHPDSAATIRQRLTTSAEAAAEGCVLA
jgi:hypothetical protein